MSSTICTHCSNGCKTTLSVRNHEIMRSNNRDLSGINKDFLCVKGRFGFDFTKHPERIKQPLLRRGDKLYPVSWEEAAQAAATKLKQVFRYGGKDAIGFIGSNRTSNEENYLLQRLARADVWHQQHGSSPHGGLHRAGDGTGRACQRAHADDGAAVSIEGRAGDWQRSDQSESAGRVADSLGDSTFCFETFHHQFANEIKLARKATQFVKVADGHEAGAIRWLAHGEGHLAPEMVEQLVAHESGAGSGAGRRDSFRRGNYGHGDCTAGGVRVEAARQGALYGAGRLREFARRGGYGRAAGSFAGICVHR